MSVGPGTWSRWWRWCCSSRRRLEWVGLIGSEEMLQLRGTSRGRCISRGCGILTVMSRCTLRSWCIRMVFRFLWLGYSNWVWRSLYNFEVVILARCCTPTNRYMKLTDLAQFCHGLCEKFCWDPISKTLKVITRSIKLKCHRHIYMHNYFQAQKLLHLTKLNT